MSAHDLLQISIVSHRSANQTPSEAFRCLRINSILLATANETSQSAFGCSLSHMLPPSPLLGSSHTGFPAVLQINHKHTFVSLNKT